MARFSPGKLLWRGFLLLLLATVIALPLALLVGYVLVRGSLPPLQGELEVAGLQAPLELKRDSHGVVTVEADTALDVHFGLGFAHGQDRFFQMDLFRRSPAGELSALFGESTLAFDRQRRLHRMRHRAAQVWEQLPPEHREQLEAYAAGVNAGLASLDRRPWPYFLLRSQPRQWLPEDSILVGFSMFFDLEEEAGHSEEDRALAAEALSPALFAFFFRNGFAHSVPIAGDPLPILSPPPPEAWPAPAEATATSSNRKPAAPGSNAWAAAGALTGSGHAQLAVDMHLGLLVPNTWYRARLLYPGQRGPVDQIGVSLPGVPGIIVGSNGSVAHGFTNSYVDLVDLVEIVPDPDQPGHYLTAEGSRPFSVHTETIAVRGAEPVTQEVRATEFGPVRPSEDESRLYAIQWIAHQPAFFNLHHLDMAEARSVSEAINIAHRAGIPTQNVVLADAAGNIAWTLMGGLPQRKEHDGFLPLPSTDPRAGWQGRRAAAQIPVVTNPPAGRIWTANNPVWRGAGSRSVLGEGGFSDDGRARVIAEALANHENPFNEEDFLQIQLSTRSILHLRWRDRILQACSEEWAAEHPMRKAYRRELSQWNGQADAESTGFPLVLFTRIVLADHLLPRLLHPLFPKAQESENGKAAPDPGFSLSHFRWDEPLFQLVTSGDPDLLGKVATSWDAEIRSAAETTLARLNNRHLDPGAFTYGELNKLHIQHPISRALPMVSYWLNMPTARMPGHASTPRAQESAFGASQRMVVQPGREDEGLFHMPTGQSGHFLSPFYDAGHQDWVDGNPSPLLPGHTTFTLRLQPPP